MSDLYNNTNEQNSEEKSAYQGGESENSAVNPETSFSGVSDANFGANGEKASEVTAEASSETAPEFAGESAAEGAQGNASANADEADSSPASHSPEAPDGSYAYSYSNLYDSGRTPVYPGAGNQNSFYGGRGANQGAAQRTGDNANSYGTYTGAQHGGAQYNGTQYNGAQNGYRYDPQSGAPTGSYYTGGQGGYNAGRPPYPNEPPKKAPKQKKRATVSVSTAVVLCICCVVLSLCAGILGSAIVNKVSRNDRYDSLQTGDVENNSTAGIDENGNVVLYRAVDTVKEDGGDMSLPEIANLVSNSVVEISTEFVSNQNSYFGQYINEGAGSGVIISQDGYIVTNNHVIYNSNSGKTADKITVRLRSGEEYEAKLIGRDSDADLAVIKIDAKELTAAVWGDSSKLVVGQGILVVGNPLGELGGTVTNGIISATSREVQVENNKMTLIQTNAAVNPGNSGGGMFNEKGELIGIINAKSSGSGVEGLGFAIPSDDARDVVEQLLNYGYVKGKVFIGVSFYEANSGYSIYAENSGILYIYSVEKGYNDKVLQSKDILLSIDGEEVSTAADVKAILKNHKVGDTLTFSIIRNKVAMDVEVTCYEYSPSDSSVSFNND